MSLRQSPAFQSLTRTLAGAGEAIACIVYDNSPTAQELPETPFACTYHHDPANPGLAVAYQFALRQAERETIPWLLLLDQDTTVTPDYLAEALHLVNEFQDQPEWAAIVPKLIQDGVVLSPHWPARNTFAAGFRKPIRADGTYGTGV